MVGTVTVCTLEGPVSYVVFSLVYSQEWEQEVVSWIVNLLCCCVEQVVPVGINCGLLPRVEGVLCARSGPQAITLVPLKLTDLNKCLVDASVRVMGGSDLHSILNHLQTRLKEFVRDPILLACPKLLQVNMLSVSLSTCCSWAVSFVTVAVMGLLRDVYNCLLYGSFDVLVCSEWGGDSLGCARGFNRALHQLG